MFDDFEVVADHGLPSPFLHSNSDEAVDDDVVDKILQKRIDHEFDTMDRELDLIADDFEPMPMTASLQRGTSSSSFVNADVSPTSSPVIATDLASAHVSRPIVQSSLESYLNSPMNAPAPLQFRRRQFYIIPPKTHSRATAAPRPLPRKPTIAASRRELRLRKR